MKLMHISDLHLGRRLGEMPLAEDQKYILQQILTIAREEKPRAVLIAGDIYDKTVPSAEAVEMLDDFVVSLAKAGLQVFAISGNHDSAERIAFGSRLMEGSGVHFSAVFDGSLQKVEMEDDAGTVCIWMLPFIKPIHVRRLREDLQESLDRDDYTRAVREVIDAAQIDPRQRNVLLAHQYVSGSQRSESEERNIGGLDNVDSSVFGAFDYVALGHLHRAQQAGSERIRYSGAPLAYSFGEAGDEKCILIIELGEKAGMDSGRTGQEDIDGRCGEDRNHCRLSLRQLPLSPLRRMRVVRGTFDELMTAAFQEKEADRGDFVKAVLTDEDFIPDGIRRLRTAYRNILEVTYENAGCQQEGNMDGPAFDREKEPGEYLADFYHLMRGREMSEDQAALAGGLIEEIWEEHI